MESYLEPEFQPHFAAWQKAPHEPAATGRFLDAIKPIIASAVRSYGGKNPSPVLHSKAKLMALDAARRYDPSKAKLRTHLMTNLQGLRRLVVREGQIISIPERVGLDLHHIHRATEELADRLGRDPSDSELADHTGISLKRLAHVRKAKPGFAESQMVTQGESGEEQFNPAVVDPTGNRKQLLDFIYHDLHPVDQLILEHTVGLHGKRILPKQEIARKVGLSAGSISQRAARIQQTLDEAGDLWPMG